jgi:D-alanyl-D-alanine carboxypeptidase
MNHSASRRFLSGLAVVIAALLGTLGYPAVSSSANSFGELLLPDHHHGALGTADGVVPDETTVADDLPAVVNLDPALLRALRRASADAAQHGVDVYVTSGWRSRRYQEQLFDEAVTKHGSAREAARWVARPGTSAHESGAAVDLGHSAATSWMAEYGAAYGLCQIYDNETWHFELRPEAIDHGCPERYADPTHDPRMETP